ncbi:bifunctional diaminohydroxyphosphoribosylaminopyrimidine deaminase/5-amino-6-(5-phosphoribosylamino)uracil reductase RibD [Marisediminicola sp. LYQ85]|uniref:bifunctional diaminohydroxyphosphoribosylaminopyrimidine deaminase/5-amino-6-(5-phosphoribosylamino)uracil reductase RibD n=1 Tax=Marisediminicola sp. LYQ85 TaxID=3391062 RepID=UPI0039832DF6
MMSTTIEEAMRAALALASRGVKTGPNPRVGCVILSPDGTVIAEGWHRGAGTAHAEVDALSHLVDDAARGATAVVTLEPCNHHGRTGPCTEALIAAGVARVVYAVADPGHASGGGAARLRDAAIDVVEGVLADEATAFLHGWLTAMTLRRPVVTLKWASSLDGRAAAADGSSQWITGTAARQHVHERRADADAIVVGTGTVIADDPTLTARGDAGELLPHQPVPVVVGERAVAATARVREHPHALIEARSHDLDAVLADLFKRGIRSVFVEGGPTLASAFVRAGLVDEFLVYLAPVLLGGDRLALGDVGVPGIADARRLAVERLEILGDDILLVARPAPAPPAAAAPALSAPSGTDGRTL